MRHSLPIVVHQCCELTGDQLELAEKTAAALLRKDPQLQIEPLFRDLVPKTIGDARSLHVDDLTEIQNTISPKHTFLQERARLRAVGGDLVATAMRPVEGYEQYCQELLGLGAVEWIQPDDYDDPLLLAQACWEDRQIRRDIVHRIRADNLRYVHPHMGSRAPWELALLLSQSSHRTVEVIAPPPDVARFANDKGAFSQLVEQMFGTAATPPSAVAWNASTAAKQIRELAKTSARMIGIKLPSSAGGEGNLLIPMSQVRDRNLHEIYTMLDERLPEINYQPAGELLVTQWVDDVAAAPSVQLWIAPTSQGLPIVEGMFLQMIEENQGSFAGFDMADIPLQQRELMTTRCLQLARVYQLLGYVGRCSFDMLLVGEDIESAAVEFVECNGRWGGTSLPMTLMNQIFGDWTDRPHSMRIFNVPGSSELSFAAQTSALGDELYRCAPNTGRIVLFNPLRTRMQSDVSVIALAGALESANSPFNECVHRLSKSIADNAAGQTPKDA